MSKKKKTIEELLEEVLVSEEGPSVEASTNWVFTKLGNVVNSVKGKKPKELLGNKGEGTIPYVTISYLTKGVTEETQYVPEQISKVKCNKDDVLMVWDGARSGLVGKGVEGEIGSTLVRLDSKRIDKDYLYYFLLSKYDYINSNHRGTGIPHVNPEVLWNITFPLPPLNEQKRIAGKVERLLGKIEEVEKKIKDLPNLLDRLRKSLLEAAFLGELSEAWRISTENIESVTKLIERVNKDREQKILKEKKMAKIEGRSPRRIKSGKVMEEDVNLPNIPDTWVWDIFQNVADIQGGVTKGKKYGNKSKVSVPYLRVANVQEGYLYFDEVKEIAVSQEDVNKYQLAIGDLLITEGGDRDKLGRCAIWNNEIPGCIHQNHIYRARLYAGLKPEYISYMLRTRFAKTYFFDNASQSVNLASINMTVLGKLPIPIPPEEEQEKIVEVINYYFNIFGKVEEEYYQVKEKLDTLKQSILSKAFQGELGTDDPSDENAIELLKEILQEQVK
ncbi:restriction endonuclease subunit S [Bacillus sp. FSL M7-0307]|uniref:restriction endonuclease subunit S n=1 Tax=Bacillus sp. FSL M7-0307 TaxID=2921530 RepID=UPI00315ADD85